MIESPYRGVGPPLLAYVNSWRHAHPAPISRVVLPEMVADHWRAYWLHNHRAVWLISRATVAVADVTYHLRPRRHGRSGRVAQSWS